MTPPDVVRFVFVCGYRDWQVQVAPRANSDLGGAAETFRALAEAHRAHSFEDHTEAEREAMRRELVRLGAPDRITLPRGDQHAAGLMAGIELPRWWVDK